MKKNEKLILCLSILTMFTLLTITNKINNETVQNITVIVFMWMLGGFKIVSNEAFKK